MSAERHILINAITATGVGGMAVARGLIESLPLARPSWKFTALMPPNDAVHSTSPAGNCEMIAAPAEAKSRVGRERWQRNMLPQLARDRGIGLALQLNGMLPPGVDVPALCHAQDPWPYVPQAWNPGLKDRAIALFRRRAHRRAFRSAAAMGFTSNYLRDLITRRLRINPRRSGVFYNGLSETLLQRAANPSVLRPLADRPMEILSVSAVAPYKRQELVIRALPQLLQRPGCGDLIYRVVGQFSTLKYEQHLQKLVRDLGVESRVIFEGGVSDSRVQEVFSAARCFVLMSVCESFGLPSIEAMSFGTPVVTSNCCAMPEVCGEAAVFSPVDDIVALTENLHRVLTDSAKVQQLREAGLKNCQRFKWSDTAEKMVAEMEAILV